MDLSEAQPRSLREFERRPVVASVETDRFCDGCGYNLRTQPIRRLGQTDVLLCRCPECGRFHHARETTTASHAWLRRLGTLLLFVWIMVVLGVLLGLGAAQVGMTILPLDELTTYRQPTFVALSGPVPAGLASMPTVPPGTIRVNQRGGVRFTTTRARLQRRVDEDDPYYTEFVLLMRVLSFGLGLVLAMFIAVVMHHWPHWTYFVPVVIVPAVAAALVAYVWRIDQPHLLGWATPYIAAQAAAHFAGGLTGVLIGRPLARLMATVVLPPRLRQPLAFLWLTDGKPLPTVRGWGMSGSCPSSY